MSLVVDKRGWLRKAVIGGLCVIAVLAVGLPVYRGDAVVAPLVSNIASPATLKEKTVKSIKKSPKKKATKVPAGTGALSLPISCGPLEPSRQGLASASISQIRQLAKYEALCGGKVASKLSFFMATPTNDAEASSYARYAAARLLAMRDYGIAPIVFFEPSTTDGVIDLKSFSEGGYDKPLDALFRQLRSLGVTDTSMGTWVPVPEGNTPVWSTLDPVVYGRAVTKAVTFQKKHFPNSKASLLLSSTTFYGSPDWDDGKSASLRPYLAHIKAGIIDSFGMQGLPWVARGNASITNGAPSEYLRSDIAVEAGKVLGVREVWLNTGTFGRKYVGSSGETKISDKTRSALLDGVINVSNTIKKSGFSVSIHLFAEDKSTAGEATDWSYWTGTSGTQGLIKKIVHDTTTNGIGLWLYDNQR